MYEIFDELCQKKGVKPGTVARETGLSKAMLSDWKAGRYSPKADKLQVLADYFGVSLEYMRTGEEPHGYYTDPETAKAAQRIFKDPHMRILFDAAEDARPEDLDMAAALLRRMKETNPDG